VLRQAGLQAQALPLIGIGPAPDRHALDNAWQRLAQPPGYSACMFVSANAVDYFFAAQPPGWDVFSATSPHAVRAYVTGPGSRAALLRHKVALQRIDSPHAQAGVFDSEALLAQVAPQLQPGCRVLLVRGTDAVPSTDLAAPAVLTEPTASPTPTAPTAPTASTAPTAPTEHQGIGRDWFASQVLRRGGAVDFVVAYQRGLPEWDAACAQQAQEAAGDGAIWLLSSAQSLRHLQILCPGQSWQAACAVATHPRIAQAARQAGFGVVRQSSPAVGDLLATIESML
jgi:uroporphyrinogen-III synthase